MRTRPPHPATGGSSPTSKPGDSSSLAARRGFAPKPWTEWEYSAPSAAACEAELGGDFLAAAEVGLVDMCLEGSGRLRCLPNPGCEPALFTPRDASPGDVLDFSKQHRRYCVLSDALWDGGSLMVGNCTVNTSQPVGRPLMFNTGWAN